MRFSFLKQGFNSPMDYMSNRTALILSSGRVFFGKSFGMTPPTLGEFSTILIQSKNKGRAAGNFAGELVFNTAMTGYVEVLSDPSFSGQLICMTYPHIGNYGVEVNWSESGSQLFTKESGTSGVRSKNIMAAGLIVRELYRGPIPENRVSLSNWMQNEGIAGICNIDTRSLTLYLRDHGTENAAILTINTSNESEELNQSIALLKEIPKMEGRDIVSEVVLQTTHRIRVSSDSDIIRQDISQSSLNIGILDFGCKHNIIRLLEKRNCNIDLLSYDMTFHEILRSGYDMILVSNGPGDPAVLNVQQALIASIIGKVTLCGICLGTQLLALSMGAQTYKMPFGHHGINHPVRNELDSRLYITSQNHGFAVDEHTLPHDSQIWFRNTNDNSLEGFICPSKRIYSVQFHPEAAPGPSDTMWIIDYFLEKTLETRTHLGNIHIEGNT